MVVTWRYRVLQFVAAIFGCAQASAISQSVEFSQITDCTVASNNNAEEALAAANRWMERNPGPDAAQCLSSIYDELGQAEEAISMAEHAAELSEAESSWRAPSLWRSAAVLAGAAQQPERALRNFQRGLDNPQAEGDIRGELLVQRALFLASMVAFDQAEADLAEARELIPYDSDTWILSADLACRRNDAATCADFLGRAFAIDPTDAAIAYRVGEIASVAGETEAACEAWHRAMELEPNGPFGVAAARRFQNCTAEW